MFKKEKFYKGTETLEISMYDTLAGWRVDWIVYTNSRNYSGLVDKACERYDTKESAQVNHDLMIKSFLM